ncbi:hypothetical protein AVEN_59791-1 [Araneus ventricosus]|uniref:Uncharacterized protein n=1 Tax=Araneus ventricosus TaxID=182803 RepID=A0A4Y2K608_ARAVE|nr:hypothetical protein AVEN_59791-1 [Araneus ventricosus]
MQNKEMTVKSKKYWIEKEQNYECIRFERSKWRRRSDTVRKRSYLDYPHPESIRDHLNDSGYNVNTRSEGGVLMNITSFCPTPPAGGTSRHGVLATQPHTTTTSTREARTAYLCGGFSSTYSCCPPVVEFQ